MKCNVREGKLILHLDTMPFLKANLGLKRKIVKRIHTAKEMGDAGGSLLTLAHFEVGTREEHTLLAPCVSPIQVFWVLQFEDPHRAYNPRSPSLAASSSCRKLKFLVDPKHSAIRYYCLG